MAAKSMDAKTAEKVALLLLAPLPQRMVAARCGVTLNQVRRVSRKLREMEGRENETGSAS